MKGTTLLAGDSIRRPDSIPPAVILLHFADTLVTFHLHGQWNSELLFLVIHDDENTSSEVAFNGIKKYGASLLEMKNDNKYLFTLMHDSTEYLFNPNRIFSLNGIESTLEQYGPCDSTAVLEIDTLARQVVANLLLQADFIVALHNNRNNGFSASSYIKDTLMAKAADSVFINPLKDPDDFFYVNDPAHFQYIRSYGYNVVLQAWNGLPDDGSLSVFCHRMGIPYINIEAEQGHQEEQSGMLALVMEMIGRNLP